MLVKAREVNRAIEKAGGVHVRTVGSHRRYEVTRDSKTIGVTVAQHSGDIPVGTLAQIERTLVPLLGERWLRR